MFPPPVPTLAAETLAVPVLMTAPTPELLPLCALLGAAAVAPTPLVSAPCPLTTPALAAPPPALDVVGAVGAVGLVLVSVALPTPLAVAALDAAVAGGCGGVCPTSVGNVTAPLPTWPPPSVPGVGVVSGVVCAV
ncbi:MAG TPA: hypothetical protein VMB84_16520 [Stellaceae bacterium]|nr:hypothetical protein [Stellaceae bacterium]